MATDTRFDVPEEIAVRVPHDEMTAAAASLFRALGLDELAATQAADVLVYADLRGVDSHGVSNMFPIYVHWFQTGFLNARPRPFTVAEALAVATIDDDRGLGLATSYHAVDLAIAKARECGVGSVAVRNSGHFGAAGFWAHRMADADMIGVAMTIGGLQVAPTAGSKAMLGLNPIAVAAPARSEAPFVFDASMSSVAGNKIRIARRLGANVAPGWIADANGTPIMESAPVPNEFLMLPVGGTRELGSHKGYGLALAVDVLCNVLSGTGPGFATVGQVSHQFTAYRIDAFGDLDEFKTNMDIELRGLRECPQAPGEERVLYAGLPEIEAEQDRRVRGIPYHPDVIDWFRATARELGADQSL